MKIISLTILLGFLISGTTVCAQKAHTYEEYGHTLNLGVGIGGYYGYYHYVGHSLPVFSINYEFDAARNFTLAPFATFYSYRNDNKHYQESIIPVGVKGTLYLDKILRASPDWDFYLAGSLGFVIRNVSWDSGYYGDKYIYHDASPLFLDLHIGTEYHLNKRLGLFLDLSTGVSTIGLAFH